ncbi:hypothetical protein D3C81_2100370 [compost metagenome]
MLTITQVYSSILFGPRGCHTRTVFCPGRKEKLGNTVNEDTAPSIFERNSPRRSSALGRCRCRYLFTPLSPSTAALPTRSRVNS